MASVMVMMWAMMMMMGGFARVHELTDLTNNKVYAGKIIPKSRITKPHNKEKIAREIDLHRHLRHRNVVRFEHCFEDSENVYIILEYCPRKYNITANVDAYPFPPSCRQRALIYCY
ncbi:Serine/threonine-protein kinase PLK2 [Amphibalanus amphitrite]|uniref:Serine/threonine-protein kinase PLK2 n=1 Tax=Amphibalanus amphitrite TaxID=1232801 RepID=A0A6A4XFU6_AMPAM|nr:Serine/threonine-protein kinase PLK2 [Amphibalanus amphitrite]